MGVLNGKVAIVTGGGSGMGRDTAVLFAKEGARVAVVDWSEKGGQETASQISGNSGECIFIKTDVSVPDQVKNMIQTTVKRFGRLDILMNIAGIVASEGSTVDCTEETFMKVISVNLFSVWLGMKYGIPEIERSGGGAIVNFASIAALEAYKSIPAYAASKGGIISMSRVAAIESASKNIRVNCIAPGHIATPMFLGCWTAEQLKHLEEISPQGRLGRADEIAQVALFLASDAASHITATTIVADGGITARIP
jgi:NAD(P)-dependent dehydrogenase (short-subunit alcohol dehydrogenase family)